MTDADQAYAASPLDGDLGAASQPAASGGCGWLSGVLGRLLKLGDLPEPPHHGGWRA